jgi:hypothetical protein
MEHRTDRTTRDVVRGPDSLDTRSLILSMAAKGRGIRTRSLSEDPGKGAVSDEDVFQETCLRLLQPAVAMNFDASKGGPESFAAGVKRHVRQELAREARNAARLPRVIAGPESPGPGPLDAAIASETRERVRAALSRLNAEDADLIGRRFGLAAGAGPGDPLSSRERCRLCRAMARLRAMLREDR